MITHKIEAELFLKEVLVTDFRTKLEFIDDLNEKTSEPVWPTTLMFQINGPLYVEGLKRWKLTLEEIQEEVVVVKNKEK